MSADRDDWVKCALKEGYPNCKEGVPESQDHGSELCSWGEERFICEECPKNCYLDGKEAGNRGGWWKEMNLSALLTSAGINIAINLQVKPLPPSELREEDFIRFREDDFIRFTSRFTDLHPIYILKMDPVIDLKGTSMLYSISNLYNELDQRFKDFLDESHDSRCLLDLLKIPATSVLTSVVQYLLKFHKDDDNEFSINGQVLYISLEDVVYITGLPIEGKAIIDEKNRDLNGFDRVFGIKKSELSIDELAAIAKDTNQTDDRRKTAVLLIIVRSFIVPDSSGARVYTTFLRYIEDFEQVDKYAWGSALLAFLFCGMSRKAIKNKKRIHGNSWLILAFFILRIPKLQKELGIKLNKELSVPILSTIVEQVKKIAHNHRTDYQERLNHIFPDLSHDDVDWTPYKSLHKDPARYKEQQLVATYVGAIICNNYVAYHKPHLAAEQFPVLEDFDLQNLCWQAKGIELKQNKGDSEQHLLTEYKDHIKEWNERLLLKDHLQKNYKQSKSEQ
ncbi:hypothetical protein POM88_012613 [Heracleum sosnowskyi]|uniref:Aminotransferase-like plant mobile domain-containing protein n=1 Tax=Heracleum sosnowskyi TaxID=360622 RepID=A0AAD8N2M6_9APIA|nr:hypothetical protein POM88_012613 [Heracleum sosnowskyi]